MTPFELFIPDKHVATFNAKEVAQHVITHVGLIQKGIDRECPERRSVKWSMRRDRRRVQGEGFSIRAEVE